MALQKFLNIDKYVKWIKNLALNFLFFFLFLLPLPVRKYEFLYFLRCKSRITLLES